jgi:DNA-directed RNA polymerase specialized sigma24 family protein
MTVPRRKKKYKGLTADQRATILREAYRNYLTFQQFVSDTGKDVIEYAVPADESSDEWITILLSFTDLKQALKLYQSGLSAEGTVLSKRKEQAFHLNVICDMKQKDVAKLMNITTVSVGQYVAQACSQLSKYYFKEMEDTSNGHESEEE